MCNKTKNSNILFNDKLQTKQVLYFHLFCLYSLNQYVIFKQKNKNNLSFIHINSSEIGKISQKSKHWDEAIVDFSMNTPSRFQELKTKAIENQAVNETILIVEEI